MEITIEIDDFSNEEQRRLRSIFSFMENYDEATFIEKMTKCAILEYKSQFLNDGSINTISEIRQQKLFLMVKHVFDGLIPSEVEVASIFKIPRSTASTLIKNMRSRYHFDIEQYLKGTIRTILQNNHVFNDETGYYRLEVRSSYMIKEMNEILELRNRNCEKIKRHNPDSSFYKINEDSYQELIDYSNE